LYVAVPLRFWTNKSERNADGIIVRDRRHEITREDILTSQN
jgi:hypothetical protein